MAACCRDHAIALLSYGTVGGGFLSEHWLGRPEPSAALANRSLIKYKLIIDDFGGWALFQELLTVLADIARKHHCDNRFRGNPGRARPTAGGCGHRRRHERGSPAGSRAH